MNAELRKLVRSYIPWWQHEKIEPRDCLPTMTKLEWLSYHEEYEILGLHDLAYIADLHWYSTEFIYPEDV